MQQLLKLEGTGLQAGVVAAVPLLAAAGAVNSQASQVSGKFHIGGKVVKGAMEVGFTLMYNQLFQRLGDVERLAAGQVPAVKFPHDNGKFVDFRIPAGGAAMLDTFGENVSLQVGAVVQVTGKLFDFQMGKAVFHLSLQLC